MEWKFIFDDLFYLIRIMPSYINNDINSTTENLNVSTYNTYHDSLTNYSESAKYSKTKHDKDSKSNKNESMINGKNITSNYNSTTNMINNINDFMSDNKQQNSSFFSTSNNDILNYNNPNLFISNKVLKYQTNIPTNEKFNFSDHNKVKEDHKDYMNKSSNIISRNIVNPKLIQRKIKQADSINPLEGVLNPYLIQSNNIHSFNIQMSSPNQPSINPKSQLLRNSSFSNPQKIATKNENDLEKSIFLYRRNVNNNKFKGVSESEEESEVIIEDEYVQELIYSRRFSELTDKDLLSNLFLIGKEQAGCRFLQQKIDDNPNFANYELYPEIHEEFDKFICDPFGNYLVQKMLDSLTSDKINYMMKNVNLKLIKLIEYSIFFKD